jgi:hypothetical protein
LRSNFIDEIGGMDQNPQDPEYLKRWVKAQDKSDKMLWGMLGQETYLNIEANQK